MLIVLFLGIGTHCVSFAGEMAGSSSTSMEVDVASQNTTDDNISVRARKYLAEKRGHLHVGNGGEGGSVSVSSRSSTSSAIFKAKSHSLKAPNLNGQEALAAKKKFFLRSFFASGVGFPLYPEIFYIISQ